MSKTTPKVSQWGIPPLVSTYAAKTDLINPTLEAELQWLILTHVFPCMYCTTGAADVLSFSPSCAADSDFEVVDSFPLTPSTTGCFSWSSLTAQSIQMQFSACFYSCS